VLHKAALCLFACLSLLEGQSLLAQSCDLILRGKVIHLENDESIEAAYVWILETRTGAVSDQNGNFVIRGLCPGTYTVTVQYLGHKDIRQTVNLSGNSTAQTFRMEEGSLDLGSVVVHGHRDAIQTTTAITPGAGREPWRKPQAGSRSD
jgi:iron complex outermembrane receptor protein